VSAGLDIIAVSSGLGAAATIFSHSLSAERNMDAEHALAWAGVVTTSNAMQSMESNPLAAAAAGRLLVVKDSEMQTICNGRRSSSPGDLTQEKCADALARELVRHADGKLVFISTVVTIPTVNAFPRQGRLTTKSRSFASSARRDLASPSLSTASVVKFSFTIAELQASLPLRSWWKCAQV
jgi:hypothetical protein